MSELEAIAARTAAELRAAFYDNHGRPTGERLRPLLEAGDDLAAACQLAFADMDNGGAPDLEPVRGALRRYRTVRLAA
jgi:hypothetical protein